MVHSLTPHGTSLLQVKDIIPFILGQPVQQNIEAIPQLQKALSSF